MYGVVIRALKMTSVASWLHRPFIAKVHKPPYTSCPVNDIFNYSFYFSDSFKILIVWQRKFNKLNICIQKVVEFQSVVDKTR